MQETTFRPDQTSIFGQQPVADFTTLIPNLIQDLESDNAYAYVPALKQLLNIILDNHENKDLALKFKLYPILNKFAGNIIMNEEFVLSTTILHVIGVRNSTNDKAILAGVATQSLILNIFTSDEKQSKAASNALEGLIEENEIIRNSLLKNGFLLKVQHTFTHSSQQSSSSSQTKSITPNYLASGLLDIILKLLATADDIQPIAVLIPSLNEMKINGENNIKKKSMNILGILSSQGIIDPSSESSKDKDEKIHQLEEANLHKDEIIRRKEDELRVAEEQARINEQQKLQAEEQLRDQQKQTRTSDEQLRISQEQLRTQEADIQRLQIEITQLRQSQAPTPAQHSTSVLQLDIDRNTSIEDNTSKLENLDSIGQNVRLEKTGEMYRKVIALKDNYLCISLNKVIIEGIHRIEVIFDKCYNKISNANAAVGIMKTDYQIPYPCNPYVEPNRQYMLYYHGNQYMCFKGTGSSGNIKFLDGQLIAMELNADVGTLHLFVDGIQQPVFVRGINEAVKFFFFTYNKDSSISIVSVKKLAVPTATALQNEKAFQW
ncbi:MAG: hypothetical protein EZS28_022294 [Streblomastix strix]|uniref:SPRY domain-containing protein n=1 Tax=Streblomastix strix TaxID=222440 RepID=A0A5J4VIK4_9EUKA|nr:MAG: hypothetical protein EZS28_022294 [Streblomastix strix]